MFKRYCFFFKIVLSFELSNICFYISRVRIHWKLFTILKRSNKSVWSNVFWYVKVCIFRKCIQYTIHWDKTQILKKFPSDKINGTKNLSSNSSVLLLICDFYISCSARFVSLKMCERFSIFDSVPFLLKFIFLFNKMHGLFDFKTS